MPSGIYIRTAETKAKMSTSHTGKHLSEEAKTKLSTSRTGKHHSTETVAKMSASHIDVPLSEEHKANIAATLTGYKQTIEHITNSRAARIKQWKEHPEKHHFYVDGSCMNGSPPSYHANFTEEFRELIRDRDNYVCKICKLREEQLNRALCIHHIYYDAETNDCSKNEDFVSLCSSCHSATNINREYWTRTLRNKIWKI